MKRSFSLLEIVNFYSKYYGWVTSILLTVYMHVKISALSIRIGYAGLTMPTYIEAKHQITFKNNINFQENVCLVSVFIFYFFFLFFCFQDFMKKIVKIENKRKKNKILWVYLVSVYISCFHLMCFPFSKFCKGNMNTGKRIYDFYHFLHKIFKRETQKIKIETK